MGSHGLFSSPVDKSEPGKPPGPIVSVSPVRHRLRTLRGRSETAVDVGGDIADVVLQIGVAVFQRHFHLPDGVKHQIFHHGTKRSAPKLVRLDTELLSKGNRLFSPLLIETFLVNFNDHFVDRI